MISLAIKPCYCNTVVKSDVITKATHPGSLGLAMGYVHKYMPCVQLPHLIRNPVIINVCLYIIIVSRTS